MSVDFSASAYHALLRGCLDCRLLPSPSMTRPIVGRQPIAPLLWRVNTARGPLELQIQANLTGLEMARSHGRSVLVPRGRKQKVRPPASPATRGFGRQGLKLSPWSPWSDQMPHGRFRAAVLAVSQAWPGVHHEPFPADDTRGRCRVREARLLEWRSPCSREDEAEPCTR